MLNDGPHAVMQDMRFGQVLQAIFETQQNGSMIPPKLQGKWQCVR